MNVILHRAGDLLSKISVKLSFQSMFGSHLEDRWVDLEGRRYDLRDPTGIPAVYHDLKNDWYMCMLVKSQIL